MRQLAQLPAHGKSSELYSSNTSASGTTAHQQHTEMDIHEVDPLIAAEIYMSYGRDEEAENILINTLAKTSYQHELSLGLLKIYADRKDVASFNRVANKVYKFAGRPEDAVIWGKIAILGLKIDPENPLYQIEGVAQEQSNANQAESNSRPAGFLARAGAERTVGTNRA